MALDLRPVQGIVAGIVLADRCTIWRDPEGNRDDALGPDGLSFTDDESTSDSEPVETDLACGVKWVNRYPHTGESGEPIVISEYMVKFGMPFDNVQDGDWIEITETVHDERLIGRKLKVIEVVHGTLVVLRKVRCQMRERSVDVP